MNKELLSTLGLCKRAGMLEAGEEPVESAARARDVRLLLLAQDAAENTARRAEHFAQMGQCILVSVPFTKEELGRAVGARAARWRGSRTWALPAPSPAVWRTAIHRPMAMRRSGWRSRPSGPPSAERSRRSTRRISAGAKSAVPAR